MRAKRLLLLSAGLGIGAALVGVAHSTGRAEPSEAPQDDEARRSQVIVRGEGVEITVGEVEDAVNDQSPFLRSRYQEREKLDEFVDNMVRFELLAKEAERRGFDEHRAVVRTVKQNAVQQLVRKEFDEKITPKSISEETVREYYESHADEFRRPEMVRAAHILLPTKKAAQELLPEAKEADMRAFRELAREHSTDTETKQRGGDLRYFTREGRPPRSQDAPVAPEIVEAAFGLDEVGDVTPKPIQVGDNWTLVKLTGRRQAEEKSFEDAQQSIRLKLWRQRREKAVEGFVDELREKYEPEIHPDRMRPIQLDTAAPSSGFPPHSQEGPGKKGPGKKGPGNKGPTAPPAPAKAPPAE